MRFFNEKKDEILVHRISNVSQYPPPPDDTPSSQDDTSIDRTLAWHRAGFIMCKTQIGIGVLGLPSAFHALGLIPGAMCLLGIAALTFWASMVIGNFKLNHPQVYSMDDVGQLAAGRWGRRALGSMFCVYWIFVAASAILSQSIALNAMSQHATCTLAFLVVPAILGFLLSSLWQLQKLGWIAWAGVTAVISALITLMIAVGVQTKPAAAPQGPWKNDFQLVGNPTFLEAALAISSIVFSFAGTTAFFPIVSEMRSPKKFWKALTLCYVVVTATYLIVAVVVYRLVVSYVASPALGSAGPLLKRICYGIAFPGIAISTGIVNHLTAKYIFVRFFQRSTPSRKFSWRRSSLNSSSCSTEAGSHVCYEEVLPLWRKWFPEQWITWLCCTTGMAVISFVIAFVIPDFNSLIQLIGALFGTLMSFHLTAFMCLYDSRGKPRTWKWKLLVSWCVFVLILSTYFMITGTYAAIVNLEKVYSGLGHGVWFCRDNSHSV